MRNSMSLQKFFLLKDVNGKLLYSFDEYRTLVEAADRQTRRERWYTPMLPTKQVSMPTFRGAEEKGYNVLLLDGQLDSPRGRMLESKLENPFCPCRFRHSGASHLQGR